MSVYQPKGSPYYHFDFQWRGHRFHGSTKCTNRREAEAFERAERDRVKQLTAQSRAASTSLKLDDVAGRYWNEVGKHHSGKNNTWRDLERIVEYFGANKLITEISNNDIAHLVAWRRGHRIVRKKGARLEDCPLVSNTTVNRSTTEVVKKLFTRAKKAWGVRFDREPSWREHRLDEPEERVRELVGDEGERLERETRDDYMPFFEFVKATGLRRSECVFLEWSQVDWNSRQIRKPGKGGKIVSTPITPTIRAILWPLRGHDPRLVFTYVAQRTREGRVRGHRYPLTTSGVKSLWARLRKRAGVEGFRFHDFRHDLATKMLRDTGNLKLVQRALNHSNIKTTTRYAHVLDSEVAEALEQASKSRKKPRNAPRKVG